MPTPTQVLGVTFQYSHTISRHGAAYNIEETQQKMRQANLPQVLIDRLDHGW